jgi:hypothetical protein
MSEKERPRVDARGADGGSEHSHYTRSRPERQALPAHGTVQGGVWTKRVRKSAHLLHSPRGWAVDCGDLERAERLGVTVLELHEAEESRVYRVALAAFRRRGIPVNRGAGAQVALPLGAFEVVSDGDTRRPDAPRQLGLFGGRP